MIREQEAHLLPVVVDGEYRRNQFMESFADVAGFETGHSRLTAARRSEQVGEERPGQVQGLLSRNLTRATEPLRLRSNRPLEEWRFAQELTDRPVKVTLIGPDRVFQAYDEAGSTEVYPDAWAFLDAVARVQNEMVGQLVAAGCRYVHMDAPGFTAYVDRNELERMRARGQDPREVTTRTIAAENAAIAGHEGTTFGIHLCRGNRQSHWHREGAYDDIAEQLFSELKHQRLLLEYDTERAGSFAPLRFVPADEVVVLGLITTKDGRLETVDELLRRIDEASQYLPVEQLAISPQCGFASSIEGDNLSPSAQWAKLDRMLDVAELVWGSEVRPGRG